MAAELITQWGGLGRQRQLVTLEPRDRSGSKVPPGRRAGKRHARRKASKLARQRQKRR